MVLSGELRAQNKGPGRVQPQEQPGSCRRTAPSTPTAHLQRAAWVPRWSVPASCQLVLGACWGGGETLTPRASQPLLHKSGEPLEQVSPLSSNSALTHSLTRQPALFKAGRKEQPRAEQRGSQVLVLLQQYPSRLPSSSDLLGGPQFSHLQTGNSFPARLHLPCLPPRLRRMGRDTGVKHSVT